MTAPTFEAYSISLQGGQSSFKSTAVMIVIPVQVDHLIDESDQKHGDPENLSKCSQN